MRREPSLTFEGALRILGHHEPGLIGKLDTSLGGVIMAAGAGIGLAAAGGPALAPAAVFAAVWGLTDQKSEAVSLLGKAIGAVSRKLAGTRGYERRQLIAAAHTTIVVAAFFESFQEHAGKGLPGQLKISDSEKETLIAHSRRLGETVYDVLYAAEIPAPSSAYGFEENLERVKDWCTVFTDDLGSFLRGLGATENKAALQLLFKLPRVFQLDHEVLAAVAISGTTLLDEVSELRNPEIYDRFAAYLGELFPETRLELLSDEEVSRGRDVLRRLSRRRESWDFDDDQRP